MTQTFKLRDGVLAAVFLYALTGCVPLAVGALGTTGVIASDPRTPGKLLDDERIELLARGGLAEDAAFNDKTHINVTSYNGRLLLSGEVPSPDLKERAGRLALGIEGVSKVFNELQVAEPSSLWSRSRDSSITAEVKTRMLATKDFPSTHFKIVTEARVSYLMGLVTREQGRVGTEIARRVSGVEKIVHLFEYREAP